MEKILYKKYLGELEQGLTITTRRFVCVKETPCYWHCVEEFRLSILKSRLGDENIVTSARKIKALKMISKTSKRFAFETEQEALDYLVFIKKRQLGHIERTKAFINGFLDNIENVDPVSQNYGPGQCNEQIIKGTESLVSRFLFFE